MISQEKYIKELLKKLHMTEEKPIETLMGTSSKLDTDEPGPHVNETTYSGIIGSLLYLTSSRPDIVISVGCMQNFKPILRSLT